MKTVLIDAATAAQLAEFASVHLGLADVTPAMSREQIVSVLREAGYEADTIDILDPKVNARRRAKTPGPQSPTDPNRLVMIHVASTEGPGGNRPIPVSVNGQCMLVPRGKNVEVPWKYLHALQNAVASQAEVDDNGAVLSWRDAPAFPVSVLSQ